MENKQNQKSDITCCDAVMPSSSNEENAAIPGGKLNGKSTMTVSEMNQLLGLSKGEGYWLLKKGYFEVVKISRQQRIVIKSFNEWYANQLQYRLVNGPLPGANIRGILISRAEAAEFLQVSYFVIDSIIEKNDFHAQMRGRTKYLNRAEFMEWYHSQKKYRSVEDRIGQKVIERKTLTLPEIAKLLGIHRNNVYYLVNTKKLYVIYDGTQKLVPVEAFLEWYRSQKVYHIGGNLNGIYR